MKKIYIILIVFLFGFSERVISQKLLLDGFKFTEGPVIDESGNLYFTDITEDRIYYYYNDKLSIFMENSGGANGLGFSKEGNLIACAGKSRQLVSISPSGTQTVLVDSYNGKKLNSPNDLWIHPGGGIYFTDPRYGNADDLEQDGMHVYYLSPRGKLSRVIDDLVRPNGIGGTDDGDYLFVVDHGVEKTYRYSIKGNGLLKNKKLFVEFGTDGLSVDKNDNVYLTNGKRIDVYDYAGDLIKTYNFPAVTTNVYRSDGKAYVTTQSGQVYIIR